MTTDTLNSAVPAGTATPASGGTVPVTLRPRVAGDMPGLIELCARQQPSSNYPWCWPPPMPPRDFIARETEQCALVAFSGTKMVGHVAVQRIERDAEGATWLDGLAVPAGEEDRVASVSVLFLDPDVLGAGVGGRLLDAAVHLIRHAGAVPVLDVLGKRKAHGVYVARGFQSIGYGDPEWLRGSGITDRVEFFFLPQDTGRSVLDLAAGGVGGKERTILGDSFVPVQVALGGQLTRPTMSDGETDLVACRLLADDGEERERRGSKAWLASTAGGALELLVEKGAVQAGQRLALSVPTRAVALASSD